jgi:hypothetical protein
MKRNQIVRGGSATTKMVSVTPDSVAQEAEYERLAAMAQEADIGASMHAAR